MKKQKDLGNLLPVKNENGTQTVDARKLHAFLKVKTLFKDWIVRRIEEYEFVENEDYILLLKNERLENQSLTKAQRENLNITKDYDLTLDMAKELAMVERNETGRVVRRYFIECEKKLRNILQPIGGVDPIVQGIKCGYPRKEIFEAAGYSSTCGAVGVLRKRYAEHFFFIGRTACVSAEFAKLRYEQGQVRQLEINFNKKHNKN